MDESADDSLTQAAAGGDRQALEALLEQHLGALHAFLRASAGPRLRQAEDIEDLAQSVCRELLDHADRFQHGHAAGFRRWLFQEARRKVLSRRRYLEAERRDRAPVDAGSDPAALERLMGSYRAFTSPSQKLALGEQVQRVEEALDELPEEQRRVVLLAYIGEWSRADIAAELGKGEGAVRMILHRGLAALAVRLSE